MVGLLPLGCTNIGYTNIHRPWAMTRYISAEIWQSGSKANRIVLEMGAQKPGFLGKYFVATDRLGKNPVSSSECVSPVEM